MAEENVSWSFYGYQTPAEGDPVQEWFDQLADDAKDEARDLIYAYLRVTPRHRWCLPDFEAFDADISEIRFMVSSLNKTYRIYGTFWPKTRRYSYTFLVGKEKKVKNDKRGVRLANARLKKLLNGEA